MSHSDLAYMTPHAFIDRHGTQLRKALPDLVDLPIINVRLTTAMANGLNWDQGLEYALEQRRLICAMRAEVRSWGMHNGQAGVVAR